MKSVDVVPHYHGRRRRQQQAQKYYCVVIGVLVGMFIQFSSLCTNTLYIHKMLSMTQQQKLVAEQDVELIKTLSFSKSTSSNWAIPTTTTTTIWGGEMKYLPCVWSTTTISLGIAVLLVIRAVITMILNHYHGYNTNSDKVDHLQRKLEQSIATGTLWGISIVWVLTDAILGRSLPINNTGETKSIATTFTMMDSNPSDRLTEIVFSNYHGNYNCYWYLPIIISMTTLIGWHYLLAIINCKQAKYNTESCVSGKNDMSTPLLEKTDEAVSHQEIQPLKCNYGHGMVLLLRLFCFLIGSLVGVFIQSSTLGATYIGQFIYENNSDADTTSKTNVSLLMTWMMNDDKLQHWNGILSIMVSFIMSCFGIILLLSIRALVMTIIIQCQYNIGTKSLTNRRPMITPEAIAQKTATTNIAIVGDRNKCSTDRNCAICPLKAFVLINIEQFFVTGTVFGLNIAWMVSDYIFLLSSGTSNNNFELLQPEQQHHWWIQSILTMILSMLWCPMLLYCTGYNKCSKQNNPEKNIVSNIHNIVAVHDPAFCDNTQHLINAPNSNASLTSQTIIVNPKSQSTSPDTIQCTTSQQQQQRRVPYDSSYCIDDEELGYM